MKSGMFAGMSQCTVCMKSRLYAITVGMKRGICHSNGGTSTLTVPIALGNVWQGVSGVSSVNISDEQKEAFDTRFPESSHKEAFQELLDSHAVIDDTGIDIDGLSSQVAENVHTRIQEQTIPLVEVAAKRAVDEALTND